VTGTSDPRYPMYKIQVLYSHELQPGEVKQVAVNGLPLIAVYNLGGTFFATDDMCTHGGASLAEGAIDEGCIVCPYHGGLFDIRTGEAKGPPCSVALKTYRVEVEKGIVYLLNETLE
jgi:nitrite reductase/ring-hydroxylating ferredoxin subunit